MDFEPRMYIDGQLRAAADFAVYENLDPATGEAIGVAADGGIEDMDAAIAAAHHAFHNTDWSTNISVRLDALRAFGRKMRELVEDLRDQTVSEVGCPRGLTYGSFVNDNLDIIDWNIRFAERFVWERDLGLSTAFGQTNRRLILKEPIGVVGCITAWNIPTLLNISKIIPALAAGCTVVLKAAPDTPWSATFLGRVAHEAGLPRGVLNVVTSRDPGAVGAMLSGDPRVDMISFTGSTATGRNVMASASGTLKKVFLELGGKSPNIFLDDADFATVLPNTAFACIHAGQGCVLPTRVLLPRRRYEEGLEIIVRSFEALEYGDPQSMTQMMGPVINQRQLDRVLGYITKGRSEGARVATGGRRAAKPSRGYYVEPTVFADVTNEMTIAREEIFGPVVAVIPYDDDADAIRIANDTPYGLSGWVWSADQDRARAVGQRLRAGTLSINGSHYSGPDAPFGGYKQSGIGRELGAEGFEEYLETKTMGVPA